MFNNVKQHTTVGAVMINNKFSSQTIHEWNNMPSATFKVDEIFQIRFLFLSQHSTPICNFKKNTKLDLVIKTIFIDKSTDNYNLTGFCIADAYKNIL